MRPRIDKWALAKVIVLTIVTIPLWLVFLPVLTEKPIWTR